MNSSMFLDIDRAFRQIQNLPPPLKHAGLMQAAGVQFYDQDLRFVSRPSAAIIGVGGRPGDRRPARASWLAGGADNR